MKQDNPARVGDGQEEANDLAGWQYSLGGKQLRKAVGLISYQISAGYGGQAAPLPWELRVSLRGGHVDVASRVPFATWYLGTCV